MSNTGGEDKDADLNSFVLIGIRILHNCKVFQSAKFVTTDHKLVAKLRIRIRSKKTERLSAYSGIRGICCGMSVAISNRFKIHDTLENNGS